MTFDAATLSAESRLLGRALGLFTESGGFDFSFARDPLGKVRGILTNANQRAALLDALALLFPPERVTDGQPGEVWHPLLGPGLPLGNLYLTVWAAPDGAVTLGLAGRIAGPTATPFAALTMRLPLVRAVAEDATFVASSADGPLAIDAHLFDLHGRNLGFDGVRARVDLWLAASGPQVRALVTVEQLSEDGQAPQDRTLDSSALGADGVHLVLTVLSHLLDHDSLGVVVAHLDGALGLVGVSDSAVPLFPFTTLDDESALRRWLLALSTPAIAPAWLHHFGTLLGSPAPTVGSGTGDDPWRQPLFEFGDTEVAGALEARLVRRQRDDGTPELWLGFGVRLSPTALDKLALDATLMVAAIPLTGATPVRALPQVALLLRGQSPDGRPIIDESSVRLGSASVGIELLDGVPMPRLSLIDVMLNGTVYPRVEVTDTASLLVAADTALQGELIALLGANDPGPLQRRAAHLAALVGLMPPRVASAGSPSPASDWSLAAPDLLQLFSHPLAVLGRHHRRGLVAGETVSWGQMLPELAGLITVEALVSTAAGTQDAPWTAPLWRDGLVELDLAAWNAAAPETAASLRIGLRFAAGNDELRASWLTALVQAELPPTGDPSFALLAEQHLLLELTPPPAPDRGGIVLSAAHLKLHGDWRPGQVPTANVALEGLRVGDEGVPIDWAYPPAAGTSAFGLTDGELTRIFTGCAMRSAFDWGGAPGWVMAGLLGTHRLPGVDTAWPLVAGDAATFLADPLARLRAWFGEVATGAGPDRPFVVDGLRWLAALLSGTVPSDPTALPGAAIAGAGTLANPWRVPIDRQLDLEVWLGPDGPPTSWRDAACARTAASVDFRALLDSLGALRAFAPSLTDADLDLDTAAMQLDTLAAWLASTDGLATPTNPPALQSSHLRQPADPLFVAAARDFIAAHPGATVVLLSPGVSSAPPWSALATALAAHPVAVDFRHRVPDLSALDGAAPVYAVDLADDRAGAVQLADLVARLGGRPVVLVAHGTAARAAVTWAAAHARQTAGLVLLSPLLGDLPAALASPNIIEAVRLLDRLGLATADAELDGALAHLRALYDGYVADELPRPYDPAAPFAAPVPALPTVPTIRIEGRLPNGLLARLRERAVALAGAAPVRAATVVGCAARLQLATPIVAAAEVDVQISLRLPLGCLSFGDSTTSSPPLAVDVVLSRPSGWLLGAAASGGSRVHDARISAALVGTPAQWTLDASLQQAAANGPTVTRATLDAPEFEPALGAALLGLFASPPGGSPAEALHDRMLALGLMSGGGLSLDAWRALRRDPAALLGPALRAFLDGGGELFGLRAEAPGQWICGLDPLRLVCRIADGAVALTTPDGPTQVGPFYGELALRWPLAAPTPTATCHLALGSLELGLEAGVLTLHAPAWCDDVILGPAPDHAAAASALAVTIPEVIVSTATSALLESTIGASPAFPPVTGLIRSLATLFTARQGGLDAGAVDFLLQSANRLLGQPPSAGLSLPLGLLVAASDTGRGTDVRLSTTTPLFGVLDIAIGVNVDRRWQVTPDGSLRLHVELPGHWPGVEVAFALQAGELSLTITPLLAGGGGTAIQLLPRFSGGSAVVQGAVALLPTVLDAAVDALGRSTTAQPIVAGVLAVAEALNLYAGTPPRFASADRSLWRSLGQGDFGAVTATPHSVAAALGDAFTTGTGALARLLPTVMTVSGPSSGSDASVTVAVELAGTATGRLHFTAGVDALRNFYFSSSVGEAGHPLRLGPEGLAGLYAQLEWHGEPVVVVDVSLELAGLGAATPTLHAEWRAGTFGLALQASELALELLPEVALTPAHRSPLPLITDYVIPLVGQLMLAVAGDDALNQRLWPGGRTARQLLVDAGLLVPLATPATVARLPRLDVLAAHLIYAALPTSDDPTITLLALDDLQLALVLIDGRIGVRVRALTSFDAGGVRLQPQLGDPYQWQPHDAHPDPDVGLTLLLFERHGSSPSEWLFSPELRVRSCGLQIEGAGGAPLIDTTHFAVLGVAAYLDLYYQPTETPQLTIGGALKLVGLGMPLDQITSGGAGNNAVAQSLLTSSSTGGDSQSLAPPVSSLLFEYWDGVLNVEFEGSNGPIWIRVQSSFGPIYIEQIGLKRIDGSDPTDLRIGVLLDGSVHISGVTVQVIDLEVDIPFSALDQMSEWGFDLRGLAVGYDGSSVSVSGGLLRADGRRGIEYDGIIQVEVSGRNIAAVGSYARPYDAQGEYTSLFVFVSLPITIGGPPFFFVTGLAGGMGYNRDFHAPDDINQVPRFPLVLAASGGLGEDPMGALRQMSDDMPPARGTLWFAAGLHFTTYVVLDTAAVVYVRIDQSLDIGLLGRTQLVYPPGDYAVAHIVLALRARFSVAEKSFITRGQMTTDSWLISPDSRLLGGFALCFWFEPWDTVVTVGGYHPSFHKPDRYPDIPRVGLDWALPGGTILAELFFAMTTSCMMAGGHVAVTIGVEQLSLSLELTFDLLIAWDPFYITTSLAITASVAVFGQHLQVGVSVHIELPPMSMSGTVDVCGLHFPFRCGEPPQPPRRLASWDEFAARYFADGPAGAIQGAVAQLGAGGISTPGAGAARPDGSESAPYSVGSGFRLVTGTTLPASHYVATVSAADPTTLPAAQPAGVAAIDFAPMSVRDVAGVHAARLERKEGRSWGATDGSNLTVTPTVQAVPAATWRCGDSSAAAESVTAIVGLELTAQAVLVGTPVHHLEIVAAPFDRPLPLSTYVTSTLDRFGASVTPTLSAVATKPAVVSATKPSAAVSATEPTAAVSTTKPSAAVSTTKPTAASATKPVSAVSATKLTAAVSTTKPSAASATKPVSALSVASLNQPRSIAPTLVKVPPLGASALTSASSEPWLRAVIQRTVPRTRSALRTTVKAPALLRCRPPIPSTLPGARALFQATPAPRPGARLLVSPALGGRVSPSERALFAGAPSQLGKGALYLASGITHLWSVPAGSLTLTGSSAARVTWLDRAGEVVDDSELLVTAKPSVVTRPAGATLVALSCLGAVDDSLQLKPGPGAISSRLSPSGWHAVLGWQRSNVLTQLGPFTLLGRGSRISLLRPRTAGAALVPAQSLRDDLVLETYLPSSVELVILRLDRRAAGADLKALALDVRGGALKGPLIVGSSTGVALVYSVASRTAPHLGITVACAGWRLAGVIGAGGLADEWAAELSISAVDDLVPDGPFTSTGTLSVQWTGAA